MMVQHEHGKALINDLVGADYNPRQMPDREMKALMGSLREFGCVQPVVARKSDGLILGGHQRVEAMKRILAEDKVASTGYTIPVVWVADITDEKAKLLNVALNKIHGDWDFEKLGELFESIQTTTTSSASAPLEVTGFSAKEIDDIIKLTVTDGAALDTSDDEPIDVDAELAAQARKFGFEVPTDADAADVRAALAAFGMTSPANAGTALAKAMRAAKAHQICEEELT